MNFELMVQLYKYGESLGEDIRRIPVFVSRSSMTTVIYPKQKAHVISSDAEAIAIALERLSISFFSLRPLRLGGSLKN
ncbi:hypothetical protein [Nostoc sp.]|uniref:hypothetical protein n=1 Tax=Nostoc sp. TaxID=1180 RepID=UPI002FF8E8E6